MTRWPDPLPDAEPGTLWHRLDDADREALRQAGAIRAMPRGTQLSTEGSRPDQVWLLLSGRVEVSRDDSAGHRTVLAVRRAGDVIGELSALDGLAMSATAVATQPGSALVLPADRFAALCRQRPTLARAVTTNVMRRLRDSDEGRIRLRADVRDRTVLALLDLAGVAPAPVVVRVTQQRLADLVAAALVSVTRALDELRDLDAIETHRGSIRIPDPEVLRGLLPPELR